MHEMLRTAVVGGRIIRTFMFSLQFEPEKGLVLRKEWFFYGLFIRGPTGRADLNPPNTSNSFHHSLVALNENFLKMRFWQSVDYSNRRAIPSLGPTFGVQPVKE
jgi:hypothetical protein